MDHYVIFVFCTILASSLTHPNKQYRKDYIYNRRADAFYKLHIESTRTWRAIEICQDEGANLMTPMSSLDLAQLHGMFKQYPDLGDYVRVNNDGQKHESAEEVPIIDLNQSQSSEADRIVSCEVVNRRGEVESYPCFRPLPFICKVEAKDAYYDQQCNVYSKDFQYISNSTFSSCYKVSKIAYPWNQAYADCEAQNAHLVVINSQAEDEAVKKLLNEAPRIDQAEASWFFFAGFRAEAHAIGQTKVFKTIFNQSLEEAGFNVWSENEPNNFDLEDCGSIFKNNGKLNDLYCTKQFGFVCEKESTRET